jgi:outer membrane protein OmpA-like peptidoglycan-associated protein
MLHIYSKGGNEMKAVSLKLIFLVAAVFSFSLLFGCAYEYAPKKDFIWYHKELPQAERAVEDAKIAGKDKQCPEEFDEAKTLMEKAYETYWSCKKLEAIEMAKDARAKALALCPPPPICELTAFPKEIELGESSILTLETSGKVKSATLDGTEFSPTGGIKTVSPSNTIPYLAEIKGPGGSAMCSDKVTVIIPPPPACELTASPKEIEQGQSSTLTLKTSGKVKSATLDGTEVAPSGGTKNVTPSNTACFNALLNGPGGAAMCTATVTVMAPPPPAGKLTASPEEIEQGQSSTLTLKTSGKVKSATLDGTEVAPEGGTKIVSPVSTMPYIAQVTGPGGSAILTTTVTVIAPPPPICELTASPKEIEQGQSSTLTLKTSGKVTSAALDGTEVAPEGCTRIVTPEDTASFQAVIEGPGGSSMCTTTVSVVIPPPAGELTASPKEIEQGQSSTLTLKTSGKVTSAIMDGDKVAPEGGTKNVSPMSTTPYIAQVSGPGGSAIATTTVNVVAPPPPTCELTASPTEIEFGKSSALTLKTSGKVTSAVIGGTEVPASGASKNVTPDNTTPYIAQVSGPGGSAICTATVSVMIPPPPGTVIDRMTIHVNFDFDKSEIKKFDAEELQRAISFIKKYPHTLIKIEGHTDSIGTEKYNQGLSERRAEAVKNYLVKVGGIDPATISTVGYGETKPIASNTTKEGRAQNRRAEILILSK